MPALVIARRMLTQLVLALALAAVWPLPGSEAVVRHPLTCAAEADDPEHGLARPCGPRAAVLPVLDPADPDAAPVTGAAALLPRRDAVVVLAAASATPPAHRPGPRFPTGPPAFA